MQEKQENSVNSVPVQYTKVESFVNLNGRIRQKLLKEAKRGRFPAVPSRFSDSLSSSRRLAIDAQAVVRHWHLHPGGTVVHGHHHRGHCGQHHGNDEPLYKIWQFFICYILSWFSVGRGCGRGPAVPPPPARKAVSPTPGALLRPGRCCQLPQSWQGRYRCGHSMR